MKELAGKLSVGYVVLCEMGLGTLLAIYLSARGQDDQTHWLGSATLAVPAGLCLATAAGLIVRFRWAWFVSMAMALFSIGLGVYFVWASQGWDVYSRAEERSLLRVGAICGLPGLVGLGLLCLRGTRRYVLHRRLRIRKQRWRGDYGPKQVYEQNPQDTRGRESGPMK